MSVHEFIAVLPSNSSMIYYPRNTTTNFSTKLSREIDLHGRWLVGLSEIHVPCTILHLRHEDTDISSDPPIKYYFQHGNYESINTLVHAINHSTREYHNSQDYEKLFYDEKGGYVTRSFYKNNEDRQTKSITLSKAVKNILGFERIHAYNNSLIGDRDFSIIGDQPASLSRATPEQLFVYTNICEPCIVGDTHASLLRIVSINAKQFKYGGTIVKQFAPITYIPLLNNLFQTIDIDIRDQFGNPIAFEFGTLTVTLHFKKDF